ncbi:Switch 2 [Venturia nashicola]|uniref:Switch 2 n=1 Tax=Venturia nashicola TaxID=86259 RepID=A0A4Z1NX46_9PEZI|nr:Switch 2 [Venturia nashicola]TLD22624.1 Switch 2 [Venturia nashicola]
MDATKSFTRQIARSSLRTLQTPLPNTPRSPIVRFALRSNICTICRPRFGPTPIWNPRILLRQWPGRVRSHSSKPTPPNPNPHLGSPEPALSLSQRLKKLSREYGWSALGVYLALSALDFPFCFLAVRMLGTDRIGRWEHNVVEAFWKVVRIPFPDLGKKELEAGAGEIAVGEEGSSWGTSDVKQAEVDNAGVDASLWTQLALAYAIHKSFIFIRVPLTAAILPKVVKTMRGWGWDIGKRKPKLPKSS